MTPKKIRNEANQIADSIQKSKEQVSKSKAKEQGAKTMSNEQ